MRNILKKFLDKLAKAHEESFGNQTMDCCALNKKTNTNKTKLTK